MKHARQDMQKRLFAQTFALFWFPGRVLKRVFCDKRVFCGPARPAGCYDDPAPCRRAPGTVALSPTPMILRPLRV
eukprot:2551080-Rhodomonas_salina.1